MSSMSEFNEYLKKAGIGKMQPKWKRRPEILLHPNIPKPLHGLAPRNILGQSWWNKVRKEAYKSTDFHCIACGVHKDAAKSRKWLEGHEVYEINYEAGLARYMETVPLCNWCHSYIHDGRLKALLDANQIDHMRYAAIIQHGDSVLNKAGMSKPNRRSRDQEFVAKLLETDIPDWGDWRLELDGELHPPKYKSYEEWFAHISSSLDQE